MIWHKLKQFWHSLNSSPQSSPCPELDYDDFSLSQKKKENNQSDIYRQSKDLFSEDITKSTAIKLNQPKITITPFQPERGSKLIVLPPRLKPKTQNPVFEDLSPSYRVKLPQIKPQINTKKTARLNQVIWKDCDDIYRPMEKPIANFLKESNLFTQFSPVYLEKKAYLSIINHLKSDLEREQGGILFGNAYRDPEKGIYVKIVNAVSAPNTLGTKAHLEFTSQTWQGIMDYAKEIYLSENIVGWYHSHPNMGVFMSNTDLKTQEAFFYHPWCLSIVYDPVNHEIGYFLGKKAKPVRPIIFTSTILN